VRLRGPGEWRDEARASFSALFLVWLWWSVESRPDDAENDEARGRYSAKVAYDAIDYGMVPTKGADEEEHPNYCEENPRCARKHNFIALSHVPVS